MGAVQSMRQAAEAHLGIVAGSAVGYIAICGLIEGEVAAAVIGGAICIALLVKSLRSGRVLSNPVLDELEKQAMEKEGQGNRGRTKKKRGKKTDRVKNEVRKTPQQEKMANENAHEKEGEGLANDWYAERRESIAHRMSPIVWPTQQEIASAKANFEYRDGIFHIAIAGIAGSGKSSLINALRGLTNNDLRAAPTGVVEMTNRTTRCPDPNAVPWVWYDVPGAGTLDVPDFRYFIDQGLFILDSIIVLFDNRFTETDVAILRHCARFCIPAYIVRSKSLQHITNVMNDAYGTDNDDNNLTAEQRAERWNDARGVYERRSRENVAQNLQKAGLPDQKVYLVDKDTMTRVYTDSVSNQAKMLDEKQLLEDLLTIALSRRSSSASSSAPPAYSA